MKWVSNNNMATDLGRSLIVLVTLFEMCVEAQVDSDQCRTTIWDDKSRMAGIKNILAQCSEGEVTWNSPNGALRITMQLSASPEAFQACYTATAQYTTVKISRVVNAKLSVVNTLTGANSTMAKEICFDVAKGEKIMLFIEASANTATTGRFSFSYDLEMMSKKVPKDTMEECRPCTDEEILDSFCSSDFVVVGTLENLKNSADRDESQIQLLIRKVHHQKYKHFKRDSTKDGTIRGNVVLPLKCGAHTGSGEFLITGKMRLGRSFLQCAPRIEHWERIKQEAIRTGNTVCSLNELSSDEDTD